LTLREETGRLDVDAELTHLLSPLFFPLLFSRFISISFPNANEKGKLSQGRQLKQRLFARWISGPGLVRVISYDFGMREELGRRS
jgi:hypothetical protein